MGMHDDQLHIDEDIARRLIVDQFPQWRDEHVRHIVTDGTVNAIFRIGTDFAARFPLRSADPSTVADQLTREAGATGSGRGGNLRDSDAWMKVCFRESEGLLPVDRLRDLWAAFRKLPAADSTIMTHGDLIPSNMLVDGERLIGVLDGGGFAAADPALDLVAAWHMLDHQRREILRIELATGELQWWRGAAWAFQQAMGLVWYYRKTNPVMSDLGRTTLERISNDPRFLASAPVGPRIL